MSAVKTTTKGVAAQIPDVDEMLQRARELRPFLEERARQTEIDGRVSTQATEKFVAGGFFNLLKPKRFGGYEFGPAAITQIGFELGRACASSSWCVTVGNVGAWAAACWPLEAQMDVWGKDPDTLVAGSVIPTGKCEAVEGGFVVEGRWGFASNCDNAQWIYIAAVLAGKDGAPASSCWFLIPRDELRIDHDSWRVSGLQGTGSKTVYTASPVFVPAHRMILFSDLAEGRNPGRAVEGNIVAHFSFPTFSAFALVGPILGAAQGALDAFVEMMRAKIRASLRPGVALTAAQNPHTQVTVGAASAAIDAAMLVLTSDLTAAEEKVRNGIELTVEERIKVRRSMAFGARQATEAVNMLFEGAGATALELSLSVQRHWRDANAGARHMGLDPNAIYGLVGQERFGLKPMGQF